MKAAYLFLKKHGVTISFILGALLSVISIGAIIAGFPEGATEMEDLYGTSIFNPALNISYGMIIIGFFTALVGPIIYTLMNFKESIRGLVSIVVLIIMYFVSVAMGVVPNPEELTFFRGVDNEHLTGETIAYIDGLLIFTGIMIFLTMASLVFMMVWGLLKQR
jgi:hypothetical protein